MFELSFKALGANSLELNWKAGEGEKKWVCDSAHTLLTSILRTSHQLSHWRGECALAFSSESHAMELVFVDLQDGVLSYQIVDYGTGTIDRKKFQRTEYGRMDVSEFQESTYASVTDFMLCWGLEGYLEQFQQKFSLGDYERLARLLKRPKHLPDEGQGSHIDDFDDEEQIMGETIVWETDEDEDSVELEPEKMTHPEFQKLGWLIKKDK